MASRVSGLAQTAPLLTANEIHRAPVHERQDPRACPRPLRDEARSRPPDGEEALLHGVVRERAVAHDAKREPVRDSAEAVVHLCKRLLGRARHESDESLVGQVRQIVTGSHRSPLTHAERQYLHDGGIRTRRAGGSGWEPTRACIPFSGEVAGRRASMCIACVRLYPRARALHGRSRCRRSVLALPGRSDLTEGDRSAEQVADGDGPGRARNGAIRRTRADRRENGTDDAVA
jgi:hypothetical protein